MKKRKTNLRGINRREFIKVAGVGSVAVLYTPAIAGKISSGEQVTFENDTIPVLKKSDVVRGIK